MSITTDALRAAQARIDLDRQITAQSLLIEALAGLQAVQAHNELPEGADGFATPWHEKQAPAWIDDDDPDFGDPLDWPEWTDAFNWNLTDPEDIRRWETRIDREFGLTMKAQTPFEEWLLDRRDPK